MEDAQERLPGCFSTAVLAVEDHFQLVAYQAVYNCTQAASGVTGAHCLAARACALEAVQTKQLFSTPKAHVAPFGCRSPAQHRLYAGSPSNAILFLLQVSQDCGERAP